MKPLPLSISDEVFLKKRVLIFSNDMQTDFASHTEKWHQDSLNRHLRKTRIPARDLWKSVKADIGFDEDDCLLFDDTVIPKQHAKRIEKVPRQWKERYTVLLLKHVTKQLQIREIASRPGASFSDRRRRN